MYTTPAVIRNNHPEAGKFTVISIHDKIDEAHDAWRPHSEDDGVEIGLIDADLSPDDEGDMPAPSRMKNYGTDEIDYDV